MVKRFIADRVIEITEDMNTLGRMVYIPIGYYQKLKAERDKWKTDHELLVDDYKQILIDLNKKDAENKRLKETIMELKEMQRKQTLWIAAELGLNHADTEQIIKESIVATTMEMP